MQILRLWLPSVRVKTGVLVSWKILALLSLLLTFGLHSAKAQTNTAQARDALAPAESACNNPVAKGGFTLSKPKACVGDPVSIATVAANVLSDQYNFSYDGISSIDKVILKPDKTFIYTAPGSYTIIQGGSGGGNGTGTIACQVVTVLALDPIKFNV